MKELQQVQHILESTTPCVLATLAKVEGSSYRRAGARLAWSPSGKRVGSISGGCLEDDLLHRAQAVASTGNSESVVYDTTSENDLVWGVGLGCHGIVHVLLEPLSTPPLPFKLLAQAWAARSPAVLATVFKAPLPASLGTAFGLSAASSVWAQGRSRLPALDTLAATALKERRSSTARVPSPAGELEVFVEYLPPPLLLSVFGAGDDARPLVRLAKELGWRVRVVDPRPAYATIQRFPEADEVQALAPEQATGLAWDPWCVAVVMTHHYRYDVPLLAQLLPKNLPYLGLLGPKKRADKILQDVAANGTPLETAPGKALHAPVGLDLGGSSPEEVAFSILAEIQAVLNRRDGRPLRERTRPIHG